MHRIPLALATFLLLPSIFAASGPETPPPGFDGAMWIWYSKEPMPMTTAQSFPGGVVYFRAEMVLPEQAPVKSAELIITADNLFTVYLNGKLAGEGHGNPNRWSQPKRYDVASLLAPGRNVLAVEAVNTVPGAAGLIAKLVVERADGQRTVLVSDEPWKSSDAEAAHWQQPGFEDKAWRAAHVVGEFGIRPWGKVGVNASREPAGKAPDAARKETRAQIERYKAVALRGGGAVPKPVLEVTPPADYAWPEALIFVGEDRSLYRPSQHTGSSADSLSVMIFNARDSRAFPEHDLPAPMKVGRKLLRLRPARPGVTPQVLLDAGKGALGSPSVSFDGRSILVSMAFDGDPFYHVYRLPAEGGAPQRLTDGPFHDIDPAEMPDGRVVFTSTRCGTFEEYHNPPSRALFVMSAEGKEIRPLTNTFIFDNEPEVLADGRIVFIRSDNFFDRGKVETLLHAVFPDGTEGYTEFGLDLGPEYGGRLRAFHCGSPAPLPDGRLAFLSSQGITIGRPGAALSDQQHVNLEAGDVAALPDGRLLCTVPRVSKIEKVVKKEKRMVSDFSYEKIGIVDPQGSEGVTVVFDSSGEPLHSPVYLGPRQRPFRLAEKMDPEQSTGVLFCQNARYTKNSSAGWPHVRAIRVLAGKGLTLRSSHSYIVHAGSEVTELGTVPLAPDGSFAVEVPADTAIAFQAVDAEGRSELNEMSWIYVRPGETRGCVGCHQPRQAAPPPHPDASLQALLTPPLKLLGQGRPHRFRGNNAAVTGLMELQFDRYREVAGINRHSDSEDPLATGAQEVAAQVKELETGKPDARISAAQRLGLFRDPAAAPALARCLADGSRELRVAAAVALAACGTRDSLPALLEALEDPEPLVAQASAMALENLTGHALSFNAFVTTRERAPQAQAWREWFRRMGWERIERDLVERLASKDRDRVRRAAVALAHTGQSDAARVALRDWVARERGENPFPEWRKDHRGDGAKFNSLAAVNPRTLQAVTRALGSLKDSAAVPLLREVVERHADPDRGNLFFAEAAVEALGRIGTPEAETALVQGFAKLGDYPRFTSWYGDHGALMACHASPVHYFMAEALDALGTRGARNLTPQIIRSVPTDPDRALLPGNDDCETLFGRVMRRSGSEAEVVETCLAILGDAQGVRNLEIESALGLTHAAWGGKPDAENRAAQILSLACRDRRYTIRIAAALERYRGQEPGIPRVFDTGIPVVTKLPAKHWVCFFLARTLGNLKDPRAAEPLLAALEGSQPEASGGRPDPLGPGVLFLHNDLTPCWRAAVAWALGQLGERRAAPLLLKVVENLDNAPDTRYSAAEALGQVAGPEHLPALRRLAADYPEMATLRVLQRLAEQLPGGPSRQLTQARQAPGPSDL